MTYEEVALDAGLGSITAGRFVRYMRARWSASELQQCATGYAQEWAIRFKDKLEYAASDYHGKRILDEMDAGIGGH